MRNKIRKQYTGTDGKEYRGKAIKMRKHLEHRIKQYETVINIPGINKEAYSQPGSMNLKKR